MLDPLSVPPPASGSASVQTSIPFLSSLTAEIIAQILSGQDLKKSYKHSHPSKSVRSLDDLAQEFKKHPEKWEERPDLVLFAQNLIDVEFRALGRERAKEPEKMRLWRNRLEAVRGYLANIQTKPSVVESPRNLALTQETMDEVLRILKTDTAQIPFTPYRYSKNLIANYCGEFWDDLKVNKWGHLAVAGVAVGGLAWLMTDSVPVAKVRMTRTDNALTGLMPGGMGQVGYDARFEKDISASCSFHSSFNLGAQKITISHLDCVKMNNSADIILDGVNNFSERLGPVTGDPVISMAKAVPNSHFKTAFMKAAHKMRSWVITFDKIENVIFHFGLMFMQGVRNHFRAAQLNPIPSGAGASGEIKEKLNQIWDFATRSFYKHPLNYVGAAAGISIYVHNGGSLISAFWPAVAGGLAGYFTHKAMRIQGRGEHVDSILAPAREGLMEFERRAAPSSEPKPEETFISYLTRKFHSACEEIKTSPSRISEAFRDACTKSYVGVLNACHGDFKLLSEMSPGQKAFTLAAVGGLAAIVVADTQGVLQNQTLIDISSGAGALSAYAAVGTLYILANGPQDVIAHLPFAAVGKGVGVSTGTVHRGIKTWMEKQPILQI